MAPYIKTNYTKRPSFFVKDGHQDKVVPGESPVWLKIFIGAVKFWFYLYDILTFIPYQILFQPWRKLKKSERVKASFVGEHDGPIRHIDGLKFMDYPGVDTVDKLWRHAVLNYPHLPALGTRELVEIHQETQLDGKVFDKWELGNYNWETFSEVENHVSRLAAGLHELSSGQKPKMIIYAETRADWMKLALAAFRANITVTTVYSTLGEEAIAGAINETEASIIVTSAELLNKIHHITNQCPTLKTLIYFPPALKDKPVNLEGLSHLENVLSLEELEDECVEPISQSDAVPSDVAVIMYTSGTTGAPKGVMLTHQNMVAAFCGQGNGCHIIRKGDTYIGYLPLAHCLELAAELTSLSRGAKIGYSSPLTLHDRASKIFPGTKGDCSVLKPTLLAAVPAIMDRIFKAVSEEVAASPRIMQELFRLNYERKRTRLLQGYRNPFLDRIVFRKIRNILGGRLRGVISGGAPLNPETQRFINICMCCPVIQGYGLTETCGAACVSDIADLSTGIAGPPVCCADIVLREWEEGGYSPFQDPPRGEILIAGPHVSIGYWKHEDLTNESFVQYKGKRFFCSGDIGEMRSDGSIIIIDRKKDLVKLSHGEYVSLAKAECALLNCPLVDNICVYASQEESFCIALVVPNRKNLEMIAEEAGLTGLDVAELCSNMHITREVLGKLQEHGKENNLNRIELPMAVHLCPEVWTPDQGLLTEAMKLKRKPIQIKYQKVIDDLYKRARRI